MFNVKIYGVNPSGGLTAVRVNADGQLQMVAVQKTYLAENKIIVTKNVIPVLQHTPDANAVNVVAAGGNTRPGIDWTISDKTITWIPGVAGYDLDPSDWVVITYQYTEGN